MSLHLFCFVCHKLKMSAYGDDFSDRSFEGSDASYQKDEPPTLDEAIFDDNVCFFIFSQRCFFFVHLFFFVCVCVLVHC